ncbi:hypothetical protein B0T22DRAFT_492951 [Podospora appendiculata]|uniref:Clr5 domain-containing protein n=1 Tax=Podospora appendiculata TaxID=314037 RepID=A0AAE1CB39_9PEZI|nr:hypothetical protein B0T22DRAFT_492951 [Podospora appendiculata]
MDSDSSDSTVDGRKAAPTLDDCQGEIFQLYIVQKKPLKELMAILKQEHGLDTTPKILKTKLARWGYAKNIKRSQAAAILGEKSNRDLSCKGYEFTIQRRPVDLRRVERHALRAGLLRRERGSRSTSTSQPQPDDRGTVACRTPPPQLPQALPVIKHWRVPEKLLHDIDVLVKGSFESGRWSFNRPELIINSSPAQVDEVKSLHGFLGGLENGCAAAESHDFTTAGVFWKQAFEFFDKLVRGQYHDIIPNVIQMANDLVRKGRPEVAELLIKHAANCSEVLLPQDGLQRSIYRGLGQLDSVEKLVALEELIMRRFAELFELYLGASCYNSFVIKMDGARRRLLHDPWATMQECLPDLSLLDAAFGPSDRRCVDVVALRLEILHLRHLDSDAKTAAAELLRRAEMIRNDEWQRFYNLTRGYYFLGCAQDRLGERAAAVESFRRAMRSNEELCRVDDFGIFEPEERIMAKYVEENAGLSVDEVRDEM